MQRLGVGWTWSMLLFLLLATTGATCRRSRRPPRPPVFIPPITTHDLTIFNHVSHHQPLEVAQADTILANATQVIQTANSPQDPACATLLRRLGTVGTFNVGNGIINTEQERLDVFQVPGNIKIVREINFCEGIMAPGFIGCADLPGTTFVVERFTQAEANLWLHEFGHNRGLQHRIAPDAIMNPTISPASVAVNLAECASYR